MFIKNQKGAANLISYFLYIFISLIVLGTIVSMVQGTITQNEEKYQFDEMINNINLISNTFDNVAKARFSAREVTIFNPDVLEVDCNSNLIKGEIKYSQNIKSEFNINDVNIINVSNRLYFTKSINNSDINIDCNLTSFNKGKVKYVFKYSDYNFITNKIIISIDLLDFNKSTT